MRGGDAEWRQAAGSLLLINPLFSVPLTFMAGYLVWFFAMTETVSMPGLAPRHDTPNSQFLFFLLFAGFVGGMAMAALFRRPQRANANLTDQEWLAVGLVSAAITFLGEAIFLRTVLANPGALLANNLTTTISLVGEQVRESQVLGVSSLNNLFPVPTSIAAMLIFARRPLAPQARFQAGALLFTMGTMTLVHAVLASSRIWFLSFLLSVLVAWVVQRRSSLKAQLKWILIILVVGGIFVVSTELIRNLGLQMARAGIKITDPGVAAYAGLRLLRAYPASDVNNALIVLDCPSPRQIISTFDVLSRIIGGNFQYYGFCRGWQSAFGTINFLGLIWWDWGYAAPAVTFLIGAGIQSIFIKAAEAGDRLTFAAVLFPATLFSAMHLTRSFAFGQTLFLLPALFLLLVWITSRIGWQRSSAAA